jgi:hypothetical protein
MAPEQLVPGRDPAVPKAFTDRIRADSEMVEQVLNPGRTDENVRYPDPPFREEDGVTAPDSLAAIKMGRRTDAGLSQSFGGAGPKSLIWLVVAILAAVVFFVFVLT